MVANRVRITCSLACGVVHYTGRLAHDGEVFFDTRTDSQSAEPMQVVAGRGARLSTFSWLGVFVYHKICCSCRTRLHTDSVVRLLTVVCSGVLRSARHAGTG